MSVKFFCFAYLYVYLSPNLPLLPSWVSLCFTVNMYYTLYASGASQLHVSNYSIIRNNYI